MYISTYLILVLHQIKSNHSFIGWANAFNVIGEIKSDNPALTVRKAGRISLILVSFFYLFINVAYIAAIPLNEIRSSGQLVAFLFFQRVFGSRGAMFFPLLVSLSCFGNIVSQGDFLTCKISNKHPTDRSGQYPPS